MLWVAKGSNQVIAGLLSTDDNVDNDARVPSNYVLLLIEQEERCSKHSGIVMGILTSF